MKSEYRLLRPLLSRHDPDANLLGRLRARTVTLGNVALYFNDALIAFRQSRPDGLYQFEDQALVYGNNEFRLVFNGPLRQRRVDRETFLLDDTLTKPGNFYYTTGAQHGDDASNRQTFQADFGLA